jgi:GntR family transcriptional regulator
MPLYLRVDSRSGYPVYLQIVEQVRRAVNIGILKAGDQLPTVKQLAAQLVVNPATISRALRELEHLDVVESFPGRGSFVAADGKAAAAKANENGALAKQVDAVVRDARGLGVAEPRLVDIFREAIARWYEGERQGEEP